MIPSDILETLKDACVQRKHDLCAAGYDENDELTKGFFARYDAALAWLEAHAQPQASGGVYSHRNGETEPPTIEGKFWFLGKLHHHDYSHDVAEIVRIGRHHHTGKLMEMGEECNHYLEDAEGQWWGPVVPPWETSQRPQAQD